MPRDDAEGQAVGMTPEGLSPARDATAGASPGFGALQR